MRVIDADALLERMMKDPLFPLVERYGVSGVINAEPTVDAVEVVRCKECKHRPLMEWNEAYGDFDVLASEVDGKEDWRCPCLIEDDPYYSWSPNDNWFCANGERREADGVCK